LLGALVAAAAASVGALPPSPEIAYSYAGGIELMRPDGSGVVRITDPPGKAEDSQPAWSPNGSQLAFVRSLERSETVIDSRIHILGGSQDHVLTGGRQQFLQGPAWSPDGRQIAFTRATGEEEDYTTEIVVAPVAGGVERVVSRQRLFPRLSTISDPAWSPDGTRIAFTRSRLDRNSDFRSSLLVVDAGGGRPQVLAREAADAAWSRDGTRIAFSSGRDRNGKWCTSDECGYNGELYVMNADGSEPLRLTRSRGDDSAPAWSPDGRRIVFASNRNNRKRFPGEDTEVYSVGADGSCLTWLTNGAPESSGPSWRELGVAAGPPAACDATSRPARTEVVAREPLRRRGGGGFWLGERHGRLLLSHFDDTGRGGPPGSRWFSYDDCARFDLRQCPRALDLYTEPICSRDSILAGYRRFGTLRLGRAFTRRGVLHAGLSNDGVVVLSGRFSIGVYVQPGSGKARSALLRATAALRKFGGRNRSLEPPALPRVLLRDVREAARARRLLGTIDAAARSLNERPAEIRRRVQLARALESLPRVRVLRCEPPPP
jgi:TolB protein